MKSSFIGKHVLVRTYSAGVHLGTLIKKEEEDVLLKNSRRLWKWSGAFTLSEVSQNGVKEEGTRISVPIPLIELTGVIEVISTSLRARKTFDLCHE